uniref:Uncharacterized protein n=1 Tax=Trichogramma kaykai TaxID=54128 RepID=A0ABD2XDA4_9HYME
MQAPAGREIAIIKSYIRCRVVVVVVVVPAPHVISISCRERGDAITICRADAAAATATLPLLHGEQPVFVIEKNLLRRKRELYTRMRRASMCKTAAAVAAVARRTAATTERSLFSDAIGFLYSNNIFVFSIESPDYETIIREPTYRIISSLTYL